MLQETGRFPRRGASPPKLILLVEGDPANAQFFLHILTQEASFRVFWATNGIILYDRLHARKELEAVPALIIGASLKGVEDAIKHRGLLAVEKLFDLDAFLSTIESLFASPSGKLRW